MIERMWLKSKGGIRDTRSPHVDGCKSKDRRVDGLNTEPSSGCLELVLSRRAAEVELFPNRVDIVYELPQVAVFEDSGKQI